MTVPRNPPSGRRASPRAARLARCVRGPDRARARAVPATSRQLKPRTGAVAVIPCSWAGPRAFEGFLSRPHGSRSPNLMPSSACMRLPGRLCSGHVGAIVAGACRMTLGSASGGLLPRPHWSPFSVISAIESSPSFFRGASAPASLECTGERLFGNRRHLTRDIELYPVLLQYRSYVSAVALPACLRHTWTPPTSVLRRRDRLRMRSGATAGLRCP